MGQKGPPPPLTLNLQIRKQEEQNHPKAKIQELTRRHTKATQPVACHKNAQCWPAHQNTVSVFKVCWKTCCFETDLYSHSKKSRWTFRIFFIFFLFWAGGKEEASEEVAGGGGPALIKYSGRGEVPRRRRGRGNGAGGISVGRGEGAKYFFRGRNAHQEVLFVLTFKTGSFGILVSPFLCSCFCNIEYALRRITPCFLKAHIQRWSSVVDGALAALAHKFVHDTHPRNTVFKNWQIGYIMLGSHSNSCLDLLASDETPQIRPDNGTTTKKYVCIRRPWGG